MTPDAFLSLVLFAIALYGSPGPATMSMAASGSAFGFRRSLPYLLGLVSGVFLNFLLVALGATVLFRAFPWTYPLFKYLSLGFVLYVAWRIARSSSKNSNTVAPLRYSQGLLLNMLNPKAYAAALVTLTQFATPGEDYRLLVGIIVAVVTVIAAVMDVAWAYLGDRLAAWMRSEVVAARVNMAMGSLLALAALYATFFIA